VAFNNTNSVHKQIIGILHDVVEDTDWTLDDLRILGFSDRIVDGVDVVTKRDGEKYFEFVVRCGLSGMDAIDVKLNDLDHNSKKNRGAEIALSEKSIQKEKAYNISYFYLVALKRGEIEPGTSMLDYIKTEQNYVSHPAIVNELMDLFSSDTRRLPLSTDPPPPKP
jgi:CRISPR/Cas system-associated exonuclease Cas4 (RecB family)